MLMHPTGKNRETKILREIKRHYRYYFIRDNMHQQNSSWKKYALKQHLSLIKMVFSRLGGHMHIQSSGAKTNMGLAKRVLGIVLGLKLGIFLNYKPQRPLLMVKKLFA